MLITPSFKINSSMFCPGIIPCVYKTVVEVFPRMFMTADQQRAKNFRGLALFGENMKKIAQTSNHAFQSPLNSIKHKIVVS
jgi:hypothetical protein